MMEDILKNLIQSNGENLLVNATEAVIKKSKDKNAWKKLFVNTGEFFIRQEQSAAEHIYEDLSEILSKTNMDKLAKNMRAESGYQLKKQLLEFQEKKLDLKKLAEICSRDPGSSLGTYLAKYWKQGKYQEKDMDGNESLPI